VFVGPPDFAPDRRPFLSLADEINDRSADSAARTAAMSPADRDAWVADLFERVYETVSLLNVDYQRATRNITLTGKQLAQMIANDHVPNPTHTMGGRDALRNPNYTIAAPSPNEPLPLSHHARRQHRAIADLQNLKDFIELTPGRLQSLVRGPFELEATETADATTMRMPPFMRQSNAEPLTLAAWQYQLLMEWVARLEAAPAAVAEAAAPAPLSDRAGERRSAVLARLNAGRGGQG
jgi:hypothetical protein